MYGKNEEEKKWYFFKNIRVVWVKKLKERRGSKKQTLREAERSGDQG
jgi:hypothetical protein